MSFRIDDILKKDTAIPHVENSNTMSRFSSISLENESILQKTLLCKNNIPYNRSISEPHSKINPAVSWCPSERTYSYPYHDFYRTKALSYPNVYSRTQMWPNFPTFPLAFLPHFSHLSKRKGGQVRFTANQTDALEKRFTAHKYLSPEDRRLLADSLKLTDRQVKTWFQNRRAKWRRCCSLSAHGDISTEKFDQDERKECANKTVRSQN